MVEFTDQQRRDIVMFRGLNKTYGEIANRLEDRHGIDASAGQVGSTVRAMEDRAEDGSYDEVFQAAVAHGVVADLLVGDG